MDNFEDREDIDTDQSRLRWFIDLDWYQQNNRSLLFIVGSYLCPECRERVKAKKRNISAAYLLSAIKGCCSKTPDFITSRLSIMESVFRLFLANGNQPLDLEEMGKQLSERCGGDTYRVSPGILSGLLDSDRYYGLSQAQA